MFRRFSSDTAYIEGWGLYAEYLGYEMGIYKDPVARFGALDAELWRAIRLVTDSGIHFKGWTRQQTLDYMFANSPAEQTRAISEAERFAAIPGQALGVQDRPAQDRRAAQARREGAGREVRREGVPRRGASRTARFRWRCWTAKINRWIAAKNGGRTPHLLAKGSALDLRQPARS